jgi:hypothetical protein
MNIQPPSADELRYLIFPLALFLYYFICWLVAGRDPKIENVAPLYEPPVGISPGLARYVASGGSDGTTLAAILASLAARQIISIQPEGRSYRIKLLSKTSPVLPEEAAFIKTVLYTDVPVQPYAATGTARFGGISFQTTRSNTTSSPLIQAAVRAIQPTFAVGEGEAVIDPRNQLAVKGALDSIQTAFRDNLQGLYFRWNFKFVLAGIAATFIWAMVTAFTLHVRESSPVFLTFWLFFFTSVAGVVLGGVYTSKPTHPTPGQRMQRGLLLPVVFFLLPGFLIYQFALPSAHGFVLALLASVALNSIFVVLMKTPTAEGRRVLEQLAGFREFLLRVEQDRLDRINTPAQRAELMDKYLPYAIALGVKEGWGDTMAAAFSNAVIER